MKNKKRMLKPLRCGMLFSRSLIQPKNLRPEISAAASDHLGSDIHDCVVFREISLGLHVQFKAIWPPGRGVFRFCRDTGVASPDINESLLCLLTTEKQNSGLRHPLNTPFFEGRRVLEWDRVRDFVRLGVQIIARHSFFIDEQVVRLSVVGDTYWIPPPFMRDHVRVGIGDKSLVRIRLSSLDI